MKNGDGPMAPFHPPSPTSDPLPCLPQVTLLNTAVSRGVNCFSISFRKTFLPVVLLCVFVFDSILCFTSTQNQIHYHTGVINVHLQFIVVEKLLSKSVKVTTRSKISKENHSRSTGNEIKPETLPTESNLIKARATGEAK